jgi:hypothetical protein
VIRLFLAFVPSTPPPKKKRKKQNKHHQLLETAAIVVVVVAAASKQASKQQIRDAKTSSKSTCPLQRLRVCVRSSCCLC